MSETTEDARLCMHGNCNRATCQLCILEDFQMRTPAEFAFALAAARREVETVTRERDFALVCSGCGAPRLSAILACVRGQAACCPDCSTLTMDERNTIRGAVSALALDLATSRAALEDVRRSDAWWQSNFWTRRVTVYFDGQNTFLHAEQRDSPFADAIWRTVAKGATREELGRALAQEAGDAK